MGGFACTASAKVPHRNNRKIKFYWTQNFSVVKQVSHFGNGTVKQRQRKEKYVGNKTYNQIFFQRYWFAAMAEEQHTKVKGKKPMPCQDNKNRWVVEVAGLEPTTPTSRTWYATNCATPREWMQIKSVFGNEKPKSGKLSWLHPFSSQEPSNGC